MSASMEKPDHRHRMHALVRRQSGRSFALAALVLAAGAVSLAGCADPNRIDPYEKTGALPDDYRLSHPITLQEQIATMDIPVSVDTLHLTPAMRSNIAGFAQAFVASNTATIAVVAPSGSPNQMAAAAVAVEIEDVLRRSGVNPRAISYRVYRAERSEAIAPVRLAYNNIVGVTAPCGPWKDQLSVNDDNRHYESYGCATQQNLAAMVQNPLDLLYPRGLTPADAARRATVLDKYRKGEATGATRPAGEGGSISQVGGGG
jgi:pilus assembly protein CpaD